MVRGWNPGAGKKLFSSPKPIYTGPGAPRFLKCVRGLLPGVKRSERDDDHLPLLAPKLGQSGVLPLCRMARYRGNFTLYV